PGFNVPVWQSLVAPAGTPRPIIDKLNAELQRGLALPATREKLETAGMLPRPSTPEELDLYMQSETKKWGTLIKDIGLKIN
ncbi:MAG: tripartite tricarboxylate transporter substrate binding protein, partial [Polaromonas sp.]|nr:tripartite tricarboxylate transporter substrate binding protein [Polaromonas sp.]